jgi:hypothetical protein
LIRRFAGRSAPPGRVQAAEHRSTVVTVGRNCAEDKGKTAGQGGGDGEPTYKRDTRYRVA